MDIKINTYLNEICSLIKNKRIHSEIKSELKVHIDKLTMHYEKLGYSKEESISLSLKDMGDSKKLGGELNKTHKPSFDFKLLGIMIGLFILGFIGILTFVNPSVNFTKNPISLEARNAIYFPILIVVFFIGSFINFKWLKKLSVPFYIIATLLCVPSFYNSSNLFAVMFLNKTIMIPLLFLFGLSGIYSNLKFNNYKNYILAIFLTVVPLLLMIIPTVIIPYVKYNFTSTLLKTPLTSYLCYIVGSLILIYINSKKLKLFISAFILEIIIIALTLYKAIITLFFYNNNWSFSSLNSFLFNSKLLGSSTNLTVINTDYAITAIIAHIGWLVGIIVIAILIFFAYRLLKNSLNINNLYGKSLALSITSIISVRIIAAILMNLNLFPQTFYLSTPFLSFSSMSMINIVFLLGLFTNIYKVKTLSKI
ncbi:MAG: hypothetical protein ACRC57_13515 [Sarcina sp.]